MNVMIAWAREAGILLAVLALILLLLFAALSLAHYDASSAMHALWIGSLGSWDALISGTLVRAVPLILTGVGVSVAFRAGVFNIGAEGQLLAGAAVATALGVTFGTSLGFFALPLALLMGALAGALWAGVAALLRVRFGVLEVISTIMLNFVAEDLVSYLVRGPLQEPRHIYPQTDQIPASMYMPHLVSGSRLHWGIVIALLLAVSAWWFLANTAVGFQLRVVGANPFAARVTGRISVGRVTVTAMLISGLLAGLAGAIEITGVTHALYENLSPGYGFTAIAVAVLAGLNPLGVIATGILFAALETGALAMQRDAGVPSALASVVEAAMILAILGISTLRDRRAASAAGVT